MSIAAGHEVIHAARLEVHAAGNRIEELAVHRLQDRKKSMGVTLCIPGCLNTFPFLLGHYTHYIRKGGLAAMAKFSAPWVG